MVLRNYVALEPGVPARLHFTEIFKQTKTIVDPLTRRPKSLTTLECTVDELNGQPISSVYSVSSEKHAQDFAPYLVGERYRDYDFIITVSGEGWRREYQFQPVPRSPR